MKGETIVKSARGRRDSIVGTNKRFKGTTAELKRQKNERGKLNLSEKGNPGRPMGKGNSPS